MSATTPRKKAPARKSTTAATAARREARTTGGGRGAKPLHVPFRGIAFDIDRDRLGSARVYQRQVAMQQFSTNENLLKYAFELLGPRNAARFLDTFKPDETYEPIGEFLDALNKALDAPNS